MLTAHMSAASHHREVAGRELSGNIFTIRPRADDKFLELAVNGKADAVVTGDKDLLVLHPFRSIPILTPNDFLRQKV